MVVIKRDEKRQEFDLSKIERAIKKANAKSNEKIDDEKLKKVVASAQSFIKSLKLEEVNVEDIHKAVENSLMKNNCYEVARQYMNFRKERDLKRFKKLPLVGVMESKLFVQNGKGEHQNANLDEFSFGGRKGEMDSAFLKEHALNYYISPKFAKNHIQNRVYIHDLDSYILGMHNCLSVPMDEMLSSVIKTRQTLIRPAGSVNTAFQLIAVYFQLQSLQQFGGVAATHIDWTMVPYVRKSFMKHFKEGLKYCEGKTDEEIEKIIDDILKD
jgi:ribonucleoside-triphosphate reductase